MGLLLAAALLLHPGSEPGGLSRPVAKDARVEIQNHSGSITVIGWDQSQVSVRDAEAIEFEGNDHWIKISAPRHRGGDSDIEIHVPVGAQVEIHGHSSDVKVTGVQASVSVGVVSGNITVTGPTQIVDLATVSGDVHLEAPARKTHAESVSGDVTLKGVAGTVQASTVNGALEVEAKILDDAHFESVSGDLKFQGGLAPTAQFSAQTVSGDITLTFPTSINADFETSTFSGDLKNELGRSTSTTTSTHTYRKGKTTFTVGTGGAKVSAKSMSGSIEIQGH